MDIILNGFWIGHSAFSGVVVFHDGTHLCQIFGLRDHLFLVPVSYTHLDVYKRQPQERVVILLGKGTPKRRTPLGKGVTKRDPLIAFRCV